jgi:hypothetical protein
MHGKADVATIALIGANGVVRRGIGDRVGVAGGVCAVSGLCRVRRSSIGGVRATDVRAAGVGGESVASLARRP